MQKEGGLSSLDNHSALSLSATVQSLPPEVQTLGNLPLLKTSIRTSPYTMKRPMINIMMQMGYIEPRMACTTNMEPLQVSPAPGQGRDSS